MLKHKKVVVIAFLGLTIMGIAAASLVRINYNIMDYLPDESPSTAALETMDAEYTTGTPNARVMLKNVTIPQTLAIKAQLKNIDGVDDCLWLDDAANIRQHIAFIPDKTVKEYYSGGNALLSLTIKNEKKVEAVNAVREIVGNDSAMTGSAVSDVTAIELTGKEVKNIMLLAIVIIFIILLLTTTSWFEPVLFLSTIGVAIMLNRGTNLFFGEISFVTNSAGSVLQLAVSMDYSIFLLHRFAEFREQGNDVTTAMTMAVKKSFGSIMSSGLTTVMGFAALILMRFKIGPDMGVVMAKAIAISLISVMVFLPAATVLFYKLIDKTRHKLLVPPFEKLGGLILKLKVPTLVLFIIITVPCFFAQQNNTFTYGSSQIYGKGTQYGNDTALIEETFGKSNLMALMVPKGKAYSEKQLSEELLTQNVVTSLISYAQTVGVTIPEEFVPPDTASKLLSENYSRFVITVNTDKEGKTAFDTVENVKSTAAKYYGNEYLLVGETVNSYDLKDTVTNDQTRVNMIAILSIALILLLNFKSLAIPLILLLVIESSIWVNLSFPYFADETLFYIGYLIISSVQLGATVDYAILFTDRYIENRVHLPPKEAAKRTTEDTTLSILTSAVILFSAALLLGIISSNGLIGQLGILICRGALLSGIMVLFVLPALLIVCDKLIYKTTYNLDFYGEVSKNEKSSNRMYAGARRLKKGFGCILDLRVTLTNRVRGRIWAKRAKRKR
jgi:predicted RND superfamily exporter protein